MTNPIEADKITLEETYRECRRDGPVDDTATGRKVVTGAKFRRARLWKIGRRQKLFRQPRAVRGGCFDLEVLTIADEGEN